MNEATTPCGLTVGQLLTPADAKAPRCLCRAIVMEIATGGPRFFPEMGLQNDQRHQIVFKYYPSSCSILMESEECPELKQI